MKHNHDGFAVVLALTVVVVIGIFGLGLWRYLDTRDAQTVNQPPSPSPSQAEPVKNPSYTLNIEELGLKISLKNPPYSDITYAMRSVDRDGSKYVAAVYSRNLLERNINDCGKGCKEAHVWDKLACNKAISVYYYNPAVFALEAPVDIDPKKVQDNSQIYVGFVGSCAASENDDIFNEYKNLKEYLKAQIDKATDRTVTG